MKANGINLVPQSVGSPIMNMIDEEQDPDSKASMKNL